MLINTQVSKDGRKEGMQKYYSSSARRKIGFQEGHLWQALPPHGFARDSLTPTSNSLTSDDLVRLVVGTAKTSGQFLHQSLNRSPPLLSQAHSSVYVTAAQQAGRNRGLGLG